MEWYFAKQGRQEGPMAAEELRRKLVSGEVEPTDLVWRAGMAEWAAAESLPELTATPAPSQAVHAQPQPAPYGVGMPMSPGMIPVAPTSGLAIASMTCGIVGIFFSLCLMGVVGGLPAVTCGHAALRSIRSSPIPMTGQGMAVAGLVMGYLACLSSLWLAVIIMARLLQM